MRVLIVSQYFWPENFRINDIVHSLVEKGIEVDVLTGKPNYPEGQIFPGYAAMGCRVESWSGATLYRVPLFPRGKASRWRLALNYLSFIVSGLLCGAWLLRKRQYNAIFVYGISPILMAIPAIFLSWLKRCRLLIWIQDLWPDSLLATGYVKQRQVLRAVELCVRWIYRKADLLLVQSRAFEAAVAALAPGKPIAYYPNSVDAMFYAPPSMAVPLPEIVALNTGFTILFAGNIGVAQGVEVIVEAASLLKHIPEIRFVILGQGSRWEWLREQVNARDLTNLDLPGRFPANTMPGLMQKAKVLLVTLTNQPIFALTVPNKVQAYMASGRPILACLNGEGARLVNEAQAGLSVPAQDAPALAAAILKLYHMPASAREQLGANAQRYFLEHFNHDRLVDQLIKYLHDTASTQRDIA